MANQTEKTGTISTRKILIIGLAVVVVVVLVVGGIVLFKLFGQPEEKSVQGELPGTTVGVITTEEEARAAREAADKLSEESQYNVTMNMEWYFPDGKSPTSNAEVKNSSKNHGPVTFDLMLAETEEIIYTSPEIPLTGTLTGFTLNKDLDPGTYEAVCVYHVMNADREPRGDVNIAVTIIVQG